MVVYISREISHLARFSYKLSKKVNTLESSTTSQIERKARGQQLEILIIIRQKEIHKTIYLHVGIIKHYFQMSRNYARNKPYLLEKYAL